MHAALNGADDVGAFINLCCGGKRQRKRKTIFSPGWDECPTWRAWGPLCLFFLLLLCTLQNEVATYKRVWRRLRGDSFDRIFIINKEGVEVTLVASSCAAFTARPGFAGGAFREVPAESTLIAPLALHGGGMPRRTADATAREGL